MPSPDIYVETSCLDTACFLEAKINAETHAYEIDAASISDQGDITLVYRNASQVHHKVCVTEIPLELEKQIKLPKIGKAIACKVVGDKTIIVSVTEQSLGARKRFS